MAVRWWDEFRQVQCFFGISGDHVAAKLVLLVKVILTVEGVEKMQASTGFKPIPSLIPVQCATNWAMKPIVGTRWRALSSISPRYMKRMKLYEYDILNHIHTYIHCIHTYIHCTYIHTYIHTYMCTYMNIHIHTHMHCRLWSNWGFNGIWTHDLRITNAMLYQLSYCFSCFITVMITVLHFTSHCCLPTIYVSVYFYWCADSTPLFLTKPNLPQYSSYL